MSFTTEIWKPNMTAASSKKATMPSSAMPHSSELREEDDWTKVKDPKEKKRIQNRVAQRTYRHRMKAKLGELQARLESHEAQKGQNRDDSAGQGATTPGSYTPTQSDTADGSASPVATLDKTDAQQPPVLPQLLTQHPLYDPTIKAEDAALFQQDAAYALLNSPPHSHPSPTAPGLLSPPTQGDPQAQGQDGRGGKNSQDFMMDCLRFQSQLLTRLNSLQQDTAFPNNYPPGSAVSMDQMSQADQVNCVSAFTPTNSDGMDFTGFDAQVDLWKTQQPSPEDSYFQGMTGAAAAGMPNAVPDAKPRPWVPGKNASMDQRFEAVMAQAEAAGFESFDDMVAAYYSQNFAESSSLSDEQTISRRQRLPQMVSDLYNATGQWTDWEGQPLRDEILKLSGSMLQSEGGEARQMLLAKVNALLEAQEQGNLAAANEAIMSMKRTIKQELPNSWAMTMSLSADNQQPWQRDRSNTALATTLLLNFAGRIPNDQVMRLVGSCL